MIAKNFFKLILVLVVGILVFARKHLYLLVIGLVLYLLYKFNVYAKIYKTLNTITGNNKKVIVDRNKKKSYLKKMIKNTGGEI